MMIAADLTGYSVPEEPLVMLLPEDELTALVYGEPGHDEERFPIIRGAHVCSEGTIYLRRPFDGRKLADRSTLLHELVHHLQCRSAGWITMTLCAKETEAYAVEQEFLRRRGADFYQMFGYTPAGFRRFMDQKCDPPVRDHRFPGN